MTSLADTRFIQTLAEVKAARANAVCLASPEQAAAHRAEQSQARREVAERAAAHRFDVSLCTGYFRHATGGQWLDVPRQLAKSVLLSAGLERVARTDQAKYVLILRERDHTGKEIGYYECRMGSFPGIKLTDWSKV